MKVLAKCVLIAASLILLTILFLILVLRGVLGRLGMVVMVRHDDLARAAAALGAKPTEG